MVFPTAKYLRLKQAVDDCRKLIYVDNAGDFSRCTFQVRKFLNNLSIELEKILDFVFCC